VLSRGVGIKNKLMITNFDIIIIDNNMSNIFVQTFKRYPVTCWFALGGAAYIWKASLVQTLYQKKYYDWDQERIRELGNVN